MLPQSGGPPTPPTLQELRANAKMLVRNLHNELNLLAARSYDQPVYLKQVYETLYQPRMEALADALASFDIPELELLRQPFDGTRAASQLKNWIDVLHAVVLILSPN